MSLRTSALEYLETYCNMSLRRSDATLQGWDCYDGGFERGKVLVVVVPRHYSGLRVNRLKMQ